MSRFTSSLCKNRITRTTIEQQKQQQQKKVHKERLKNTYFTLSSSRYAISNTTQKKICIAIDIWKCVLWQASFESHHWRWSENVQNRKLPFAFNSNFFFFSIKLNCNNCKKSKHKKVCSTIRWHNDKLTFHANAHTKKWNK